MSESQVLPIYLNRSTKLDLGELSTQLDQVRQVFDVEDILADPIESADVVTYYQQSYTAYSLFHSNTGAIHVALNFDGKFDPDGYYGQVRLVQEQVQQVHPAAVLELASGRGFNSKYLVDHNPKEIEFFGIDLTPAQIAAARKLAAGAANLHFERGDFQRLPFPSERFDLVCVIESLCYATDMPRAVSESFRVLKRGGRFVVIDGFRKVDLDALDGANRDLQVAGRLVEKAMAIPRGWLLDAWLDLARRQGFRVLGVRDVSEAIIPNLLRFHAMAQAFFKIPALGRLLARLCPPRMIKNAVAGLLMPYTVSVGAQGYFSIALEKE
ncbi:MAG TPA: class I SAM-dependent methyltransferase [Anaerolineae bacterium]|nr:class I SAM-dependent methyltransferase [Anaerolineae bacterium]